MCGPHSYVQIQVLSRRHLYFVFGAIPLNAERRKVLVLAVALRIHPYDIHVKTKRFQLHLDHIRRTV